MGDMRQDWEPVVIRKKKPTSSESRDSNAVNAARQAGATVETVKKFAAGANRHAPTTLNTMKLDQETEELHHVTVSTEVKKAIVAGRLAKKLTQAQLATAINEKPAIIQEYESGKAIPNHQVLGKLERILGVKLRGLS